MKKVLIIISDLTKAISFEWLADAVASDGLPVEFLLLNSENSFLEDYLREHELVIHRIPVSGGLLQKAKAFLELFSKIKQINPDVVHCHLRNAEVLGIPAAFLAGVKKRIYTRHSSTYHHLHHPKGVIIDRFINRLATDIVSISENVKEVLVQLEKVPERKISLIHHGFRLEYFEQVSPKQTQSIYDNYGINQERPIIGMIARLTWWKGFRYNIPAIGEFMDKHPQFQLIIANARGNDQDEIIKWINQFMQPDSYTLIPFEEDLPALYSTFDYFVHTPFDQQIEAFGQTYVESLICGVPSVFTLSGIAREFIEDGKNALVVPFKQEEPIYEALECLYTDKSLCKQLIVNGKESVKRFSFEPYYKKLCELYDE